MRLKAAAWNAEWALPETGRGAALRTHLSGAGFDVICLTESCAGLLPPDGSQIASAPDYGYPLKPGRRKVILWSRSPWAEVDLAENAPLPPGRFVSGVTHTPIGAVRFLGVCIPWKDAHVRTGHRNRQPWQDHIAFLRALSDHLNALPPSPPVVLLGDFNQRIPRSGTPIGVAEELERTLRGFAVPTAGLVPPLGKQLIDHIAHQPGFTATEIQAWPGTRPDGLYLSDHDGVGVTLALPAPGFAIE